MHPPDNAARHPGTLPEWDLSSLYPGQDSPAYLADLEKADRDSKFFAERWQGQLERLALEPDAGAALGEAVRAYELLQDLLGRIMSYAGLIYAGDTSNPASAKFFGDAQEKITAASSHLLFFQPELNRLDDGLLARVSASAPLDHWQPWLKDIAKEKPHELNDQLERLFHEKALSGASAWNRLFDETISGLRFDIDGQSLALEPVLSLAQDKSEEKRKTASQALARTLGENLRIFTLITNTLAKDKEISDRWRKFSDVADSRHLANRVEREVVDALVAAVRAACPRLSHRYYRLKARWFGRESLSHWDRNAPLPQVETHTYSWEEARETVLSAYKGFSPEISAIGQRFFDERWIDAPVRPGKSPGAFAHPTVPSAHPYILLNYQGKPRDVMTLAHELGHGIHQVLAAPQGPLMAPTPLTLAETASVFGEMLTFRALLAKTTTKAQRRALLASKVEDMINTVVRQIAFYSFERAIHIRRRDGELTTDQISEIWMNIQAESLGPAIVLQPGYETYWSYIPHFIHAPFYVYAYAFGDCLVNSLYGVYARSEKGFAERYIAMLQAGGAKHHSELLAPFGLDATDPAFWNIGLGMIEEFIIELEDMETDDDPKNTA